MSYNLVFNSTNVSGNQNSTFNYNFLGSTLPLDEGTEICISSATIPYSWFNITTIYNNTSFQVVFTIGVTLTTYTITLPQGFYSISDINNFLQNYCITNGLYLIDGNGNNIYYLQIVLNTTYYSTQILSFPVPISLPSGYTQPSNWVGYPTVTATPYIILGANNFKLLLGFSGGNYPPSVQTTSYSVLSNVLPPLGSNVNALIFTCNLVNNSCVSPTNILDSFPINTTFGSNLTYVPSFEKWVKVTSGRFNRITLTMLDQNLNTIYANDPNISITLLIRPAQKK